MKRRSPTDWQHIIEEQAVSGETAAAFCKARNINPKYFSLRKTRLKTEGSSFVKATIKTPQPSTITLQRQGVTITLPGDTSTHWLAQLLQELS